MCLVVVWGESVLSNIPRQMLLAVCTRILKFMYMYVSINVDLVLLTVVLHKKLRECFQLVPTWTKKQTNRRCLFYSLHKINYYPLLTLADQLQALVVGKRGSQCRQFCLSRHHQHSQCVLEPNLQTKVSYRLTTKT